MSPVIDWYHVLQRHISQRMGSFQVKKTTFSILPLPPIDTCQIPTRNFTQGCAVKLPFVDGQTYSNQDILREVYESISRRIPQIHLQRLQNINCKQISPGHAIITDLAWDVPTFLLDNPSHDAKLNEMIARTQSSWSAIMYQVYPNVRDRHTQIVSLPAEHIYQNGVRKPLCSRVARKNLGLLLGINPAQLHCYDIYKNLDFAPLGRATDVHMQYRSGWKSPYMIGEYQCAGNYESINWNPPNDAQYADLFFSTPAGHRCVAFKQEGAWYVLDPYYDNQEFIPRYLPFPLEVYQSLLYSLKEAFLEGAAFYAKSDSHMNVANNPANL